MTTVNIEKPAEALKKLSDNIGKLDSLFYQLYNLMEEQIKAIIASDLDRVIQLTEEHALLQHEYKKTEKKFVKELENCLATTMNEETTVKLEALKKVYPSESPWIHQVKTLFSDHTSKLMNKQRQLIDLLEFALVQNSRLMYSIYNSHSEKQMHYNPGGNMSGVQAGVAINREI